MAHSGIFFVFIYFHSDYVMIVKYQIFWGNPYIHWHVHMNCRIDIMKVSGSAIISELKSAEICSIPVSVINQISKL
jgi:hypothetical protein